MEKKIIKRFTDWLNHANDRAVWAKRKRVLEALRKAQSPGLQYDLKRSLRLIDQRLLLI